MAEEEAARRARSEARAAAAAAAVADAADAEEAPAADAAEEEDSQAPRTLRVVPKGTMRVPEGYSTDPVMVDTPSGAKLRFRTLVPVPGASR